jgi:hypothetical protein
MTTETTDLMDALGFNADDLAVNRRGMLSEGQQLRLRRGRRRALLTGIAAIVVVGILATVLLFIGQQNGSSILRLTGLAITVCNAGLMGVVIQNRLRADNDLKNGTVNPLRGVIQHTIRVSRGHVVGYVLTIADERIVVSKTVFGAFKEGAAYCLYRTPTTRTILSAEPGLD